ncbi:hypothetical protein BDF20DRAFT_855907 [Mycotypha africana]|uniref:uncharacterized protein n=1 Tax=Mycotypha africana TaxID=64632 RepID=UPI00230168FE|nr:uncharacterized protein BDF20DRAFT_855907 [Mycotypha africana]KAI8988485.1 hypothetical protein BDF20DRAFT_855907 [Mycotypha africana]
MKKIGIPVLMKEIGITILTNMMGTTILTNMMGTTILTNMIGTTILTKMIGTTNMNQHQPLLMTTRISTNLVMSLSLLCPPLLLLLKTRSYKTLNT